jgi:hypothetical protein
VCFKKRNFKFRKIFFSRDEEYHGFLQRFKAAGTSLKSKTFTPAALKLMSCPKNLKHQSWNRTLNRVKSLNYLNDIECLNVLACKAFIDQQRKLGEYENLLTQILSMISMAKHLKNLHALLDNQLHIVN